MSILSYDFAIMSYEMMHKLDDKHEYILKTVALRMTQAELLMNAGMRDAAESNLKKSADSLETIFTYLKGEAICRSASLLCLIKMYFKENEAVGQYFGFLKEYPTKEKIDNTSMEYKAFIVVKNRVEAAYSERASYAFDKLDSFHLG